MMREPVWADSSVTGMLSRVGAGESGALAQLAPYVYRDLHRIAEGCVRRESPGGTMQATALIHELYLRLANSGSVDYQSRGHFFALAARMMRRILVDYARARQTAKRGGGGARVPLDANVDRAAERDPGVVELDAALRSLEQENEPLARLVEMRFFAGMTAEEISRNLVIPAPAVRRQLRLAQAWLKRAMES